MPGPGYDDRLLAVLGALRYLPSPTECAFYTPGSVEDKRRARDEARSAYRVFVGQLQRERGTIRLNRRKK